MLCDNGYTVLAGPEWNMTPENNMYVNHALARDIEENAQLYLWRQDMYDMATAPELKPHVISGEIMPFNVMLFVFAQPVRMRDSISGKEHVSTWMVLCKDEGMMTVTIDMTTAEGIKESHISISIIQFGARFPEDFTNDSQAYAAGSILKMLAFLNSPYTHDNKQTAERREGREVSKHPTYRDTQDDTVNVVALRKEVRERIERMRDTNEGSSGVRHHVVSGHHKAQWYPSEGAHHVIWIAPYERGDKLLGMVEKVYDVRR
jgi:hypothetical protein